MADKAKMLTTAAGIPVADNQNALTASERGAPPLKISGAAVRYVSWMGNET